MFAIENVTVTDTENDVTVWAVDGHIDNVAVCSTLFSDADGNISFQMGGYHLVYYTNDNETPYRNVSETENDGSEDENAFLKNAIEAVKKKVKK